MIGNDIIDLQLAAVQSNWTRKGFLEKVFTSFEQQQILSSKDPSLLVWLLWSMKEAGYKAHQRQFSLPRKLNWKVQECRITRMTGSTASGIITVGKEQYFSASEISPEMIFTSAINNRNLGLVNHVLTQPSGVLKRKFLERISGVFNLSKEDLFIDKNEHGVPILLHRERVQDTCFSFSGHGRFSAFSFPLTNC